MTAYANLFSPAHLPEAAMHDVATLVEVKRRGEYEECQFYFDADRDGIVTLTKCVIEGVTENRATFLLTEGKEWLARLEQAAQAEYDMQEK